ncbi:hypothetical protein Tco_0534088 [Tanacetum coccineum]
MAEEGGDRLVNLRVNVWNVDIQKVVCIGLKEMVIKDWECVLWWRDNSSELLGDRGGEGLYFVEETMVVEGEDYDNCLQRKKRWFVQILLRIELFSFGVGTLVSKGMKEF